MSAKHVIAAVMVAGVAVTGCARQIGGDDFTSQEVGAATPVVRGVVESVRVVEVRDGERPSENASGGLVGAAAGAAAGSAVGQGLGQAVAIGAGAVIGALLGSASQSELSRQQAYEYIVTTEGGRTVAIIQDDETPILPGAAVFIRFGDGRSRSRISPAV